MNLKNKSNPYIVMDMKKYSLFIIAMLIALAGCKSIYTMSSYVSDTTKIDTEASNTHIDSMIAPYKRTLDSTMSAVLVENEKTLSKHSGESELGNLLADIIYQKAIKYGKTSVDFAILNLGGIRIPQLPAGNVTLGKVYELMPFDNAIVIVELTGKETKMFFDKMAESGGIPISGARYTIDNGKATAIYINGISLDENKMYKIALSDYLANGGDNMKLFIDKKQITTDKLMRDAFIESFTESGMLQKKLKATIEGRVIIK